jgi:hypothetical protein
MRNYLVRIVEYYRTYQLGPATIDLILAAVPAEMSHELIPAAIDFV